MFMNDLSILVRQMCVFTERRLGDLGMGFPELVVIMYLSETGSCKQERIARHFEVDKGAISKTIAKLESKGYITREVNQQSRREKLVSLSACADPVIHRMRAELASWSDHVFADIPEDQRETALAVLAQMAANSSAMMHAMDDEPHGAAAGADDGPRAAGHPQEREAAR